MKQQTLNLSYEVNLLTEDAIFYKYEKRKVGTLYQLALGKAKRNLKAVHENDDMFKISFEDISFNVELKKGKGKNKDKYQIQGCANNVSGDYKEQYQNVKINGVGESGVKLRTAQCGAVYGLLSHWSVSNDVSTIVLPTGTGKTETMLVATLADKAKRTLVIVPTVELKLQIAEKFENWGILRQLGVIPKSFPNPTVIVLNKTITENSSVDFLKSADVIVTTPALIARASAEIKQKLKKIFSHVYFDEAHHVKANEWDEIKNLLNASKIVQFTATPYRNDRKPIEGKIVYSYPLSKALQDKCFSKIRRIRQLLMLQWKGYKQIEKEAGKIIV